MQDTMNKAEKLAYAQRNLVEALNQLRSAEGFAKEVAELDQENIKNLFKVGLEGGDYIKDGYRERYKHSEFVMRVMKSGIEDYMHLALFSARQTATDLVRKCKAKVKQCMADVVEAEKD